MQNGIDIAARDPHVPNIPRQDYGRDNEDQTVRQKQFHGVETLS
jgi:hypothetical protein